MTLEDIQVKMKPGQTLAEEIANAITHGIGAALAIAGLVLMVMWATMSGDAWRVAGVSVFGGTMVFLYLASTLYHAIPAAPVKRVFHAMDHIGISMLIAGTYTPFLLVQMRSAAGWIFFGVIWGLALTAASIKSFFTDRFTRVSTAIYVVMGWLSVLLLREMVSHMGMEGLAWMAAGGLSYTLGVIPFLWHRLPFNHAIWHLFVIGGTACHFIAVVKFVIPSV